ncbi:uncharacterized protein BJ212DRAFT_83214 [Suillus subaureus]|uniref:Uncharacterized protein n=1 Tax=Suillus subaureus TaxID=48587 RepID=A0A9P7JF98_9AGAM|nr:uncharacterized protein BJ212DRAFT_83214 [Suillus subaureus]KAG1819271.1 hypothetical protein BJ212DRAFT_83214 [Suillus subaureus]
MHILNAGCLGSTCGGCCNVLPTTALGCNINAFGANARCCGAQGCCGGCCRESFDEDHFDEQMKREMERTKDTSRPVETQPGPSVNMAANLREGTRGGLNNASPASQQS